MASEKPVASAEGAQGEEADLAKAFQELARGERTAAALEAQLSAMESKIDALLEQAEREQGEIASSRSSSGLASARDAEKEEEKESK